MKTIDEIRKCNDKKVLQDELKLLYINYDNVIEPRKSELGYLIKRYEERIKILVNREKILKA